MNELDALIEKLLENKISIDEFKSKVLQIKTFSEISDIK